MNDAFKHILSKAINLGVTPEQSPFLIKRIKVHNYICLFMITSSIIVGLKNALLGTMLGFLASIFLLVLHSLSLVLISFGLHTVSRMILAPIGTYLFAFNSFIEGHGHSLEYFTIGYPIASYLFFNRDEWKWRLASVTLSALPAIIVLWVALAKWPGFLRLLDNESPLTTMTERGINYIVGLLAITFAFHFLHKENAVAEEKIQQRSEVLRIKHEKIQTIMQNAPVVIMTFGKDFLIEDDYSTFSEVVLDQDNLKGRNFSEVILKNLKQSSDDIAAVESALKFSFDDGGLSFDFNKHMLPTDILINKRNLATSWTPLHDTHQNLDRFLFIAHDLTELRHLRKELEERQLEDTILVELAKANSDSLVAFIRSSFVFHQQNVLLVKRNYETEPLETLNTLLVNMHTVKGGARALYFSLIKDLIHEIETELSKAKDGLLKLSKFDILRLLEKSHDLIVQYKDTAQKKLGISESADLSFKISKESASKVVEGIFLLSKLTPLRSGEIETLLSFAKSLQQKLIKPVGLLLSDILSDAKNLARDLGKPEPDIFIAAAEVLVPDKTEDLLRSVFVHIVRNSVHHGFESLQERVEAGKNAAPSIHLELTVDLHLVHIKYRDDGRGLDLDRLNEIGMQRGLLPKGVRASPHLIAKTIFSNGISTSNGLTDVAGRGVGMSSVKKYVEEAGGSISIELSGINNLNHVGFTFLIELPSSAFILKSNPRMLVGA